MVAKARLVEIEWDEHQTQFNPVRNGQVVVVQFNPESLKVTYSNENRGGGQPGGGGGQFVGSGTSKMAIELIFDTTDTARDVRRLTKKVAFFLEANDPGRQRGSGRNTSRNRVPPGISFEWGTFLFRGVVDSMEETIDYFSEEGVPLRATVSLNISRQQMKFDIEDKSMLGKGRAAQVMPGIEPVEPAGQDDSVAGMAARQNRSGDWKSIAAANNIDNPRRLQPGALVNLNAGAGASVSAGASFGGAGSAAAGFSASAGAGMSAGTGAGISGEAQAGFSAGLGAGTGFGGGAGASTGAAAGASAGASAGFGAGAGASFGAGVSAGASLGAAAGASAGFGAGASLGGSASIGAGASAGASTSALAGFSAGASASAKTGASVSGRVVSTASLLQE